MEAGIEEAIIEALRREGTMTISGLAKKVGKSRLAVATALAVLASEGRVVDVGPFALVSLASEDAGEPQRLPEGGGMDEEEEEMRLKLNAILASVATYVKPVHIDYVLDVIDLYGPLSAREVLEETTLRRKIRRRDVMVMAYVLAALARVGYLVRMKIDGVYYYDCYEDRLEDFARERLRKKGSTLPDGAGLPDLSPGVKRILRRELGRRAQDKIIGHFMHYAKMSAGVGGFADLVESAEDAVFAALLAGEALGRALQVAEGLGEMERKMIEGDVARRIP